MYSQLQIHLAYARIRETKRRLYENRNAIHTCGWITDLRTRDLRRRFPGGEKEASPTIKERLTKDTIKGTLMNIEGEYYSIKDNDGKEHKIHVDKSTKLDSVRPGDMVKAYVTDQGHTTILERDN